MQAPEVRKPVNVEKQTEEEWMGSPKVFGEHSQLLVNVPQHLFVAFQDCFWG